MSSTLFTDIVTHVPADWANDVNTLVYSVFNNAQTLSDIRNILSLGSLSGQSANSVVITGGSIEGTTIGAVNPTAAKFTSVNLIGPISLDSQAASKLYVDDTVNTLSASLGNMSSQNGALVAITGGALDNVVIGANVPSTGAFTSLRVTGAAVGNTDVVNKLYLTSALASLTSVGSLGIQASSSVAITGGSINGTIIGGVARADAYFNSVRLDKIFSESNKCSLIFDASNSSFSDYCMFGKGLDFNFPSIGFQIGGATGEFGVFDHTGNPLLRVSNNGRVLLNSAVDDGTSVLQTAGAVKAASVILTGAITAANQATTKSYVDTAVNTALGSITNISNVVNAFGEMAQQDPTNISVTGGEINGAVIGNVVPSSGSFTGLFTPVIANVSSGVLINLASSAGYGFRVSTSDVLAPSMAFEIMSIGTINFKSGANNILAIVGNNRVLIANAVDDDTSAFQVLGDTVLTGNLNVTGNVVLSRIQIGAVPFLPTDATNKQYVDNHYLNTVAVYHKNQSVAPVLLVNAPTITVDSAQSNNFKLILTGNSMLANPTDLTPGMTLNFTLDQDIIGSHTLTFGSRYVFPNSQTPLLDPSSNAKNFMTCYYDGSLLRCTFTRSYGN